jgi:hypothetical protein
MVMLRKEFPGIKVREAEMSFLIRTYLTHLGLADEVNLKGKMNWWFASLMETRFQ